MHKIKRMAQFIFLRVISGLISISMIVLSIVSNGVAPSYAQTSTSSQSSPSPVAETTEESRTGNEDPAASVSMDTDKIRLIYQGDKDDLTDKDKIAAKYGDMYVLEYDTSSEAKQAKNRLKKDGSVGKEEIVRMATDSDSSKSEKETISAEDINNSIEKADDYSVPDYSGQNVIAVIDTGSTDQDIGSVSFIDEDAKDTNGHATRVEEAIREQNADAQILSLKALDDNGNGTTASVIAALDYAMKAHVSIINVSAYGKIDNETNAIKEKVDEAIDQGITVIGAAGNDSQDAKDYVPGGIDKAIIAGAVNEDGTLLSTSNYGDTVDWYVVSKSTSEAAAKLTGIWSRDGEISEDEKTVFKKYKENSVNNSENNDSAKIDNKETILNELNSGNENTPVLYFSNKKMKIAANTTIYTESINTTKYKAKLNEKEYPNTHLIRFHLNSNLSDNPVMFCIQPHIQAYTKFVWTDHALSQKFSGDKLRQIELAGKFGIYNDTSNDQFWATQLIIWDIIEPGLVNWSSVDATIKARANLIKARMAKYNVAPSWQIVDNSGIKSGNTFYLKGTGRENAIILEDTNKVYNDWFWKKSESNYYHLENLGNNKIKIWASPGALTTGKVTSNGYFDNDSSVYFTQVTSWQTAQQTARLSGIVPLTDTINLSLNESITSRKDVDVTADDAVTNPLLQYSASTSGIDTMKKAIETAGSVGISTAIKSFKLTLSDYTDGDIVYKGHWANDGWRSEVKNGTVANSANGSRDLQAMTIHLTGNLAKKYDIWYRAQCQTIGWQSWKKNGEIAGTVGQSKRLEAYQAILVKKGHFHSTEGAEYTVYSDANCTQVVGKITTKANSDTGGASQKFIVRDAGTVSGKQYYYLEEPDTKMFYNVNAKNCYPETASVDYMSPVWTSNSYEKSIAAQIKEKAAANSNFYSQFNGVTDAATLKALSKNALKDIISSDDTYVIKTVVDSNQVLNAYGGPHSGGAVITYNNDDTVACKWQIEWQDDGTVKIKAMDVGNGQYCFNVKDGKYTNGTQVITSDSSTSANERFIMVPTETGIKFVCTGNTSYVIYVPSTTAANATNVTIHQSDGSKTMFYTIEKFVPQSAKWSFTYDTSTQNFTINPYTKTSGKKDMALGVDTSSNADLLKLVEADANDGSQKWTIKDLTTGEYLYTNTLPVGHEIKIINDSENTQSDGSLNVSAGTYYIKETKAPSGYQLDSTVQKVTVASGSTALVNQLNKEYKNTLSTTASMTDFTSDSYQSIQTDSAGHKVYTIDNALEAAKKYKNKLPKITDTLHYSGLEAGRTYKVVSTLYDKETGDQIKLANNADTITSLLTPTSESGDFTVTFDNVNIYNQSLYKERSNTYPYYRNIVIYEEIIDLTTGNTVVIHKDQNDENQSLYLQIKSPNTDTKTTPLANTGGTAGWMLIILAMLGGAYAILKDKKEINE